jgi:ABC-type transport system substrate-binding protein
MTYLNDVAGAKALNDGKATELAGVKAVDDRTFQVTIDKSRPYFLAKLTYPTGYVVCKEAIEGNGGQVDEKSMIGTGPFKLESYSSGYEVRLAANPDYHGAKPILSGIERPILPDSLARQNKFESGGTDYTDVQRADLDRIQKDPTLSKELKEFPRANIWYLALNQLAFEPFKKKEVRQAFAYAINKDELIRIALRGTAQRANGIVPPGVQGYDEKFTGIPYDPAKARDLLARAGYPGGKGLPKLTISFRQGYQYIADSVLAIRNDLKQNLGIEADTRQVEWGQFLTERRNGTMPCFHLRWAADYLDPQDFLSTLLRSGSKLAHTGYHNPQFDALCDRADAETDMQKRIPLYQEADRIAMEDAAVLPLIFYRQPLLVKPYVKDWSSNLQIFMLPHTHTRIQK